MSDPGIQAGVPVEIAPGLRRLTAPNPSPMTGPGTNSYIVGSGPFVVVDPGVDDVSHIDALLAACAGHLVAICLTHRHPDHAGGAVELARRTQASIHAWPRDGFGAHDLHIRIDRALTDDEILLAGDTPLIVRHTPGHAADHVAFELPEQRIVLAGDALMSGATVVILPPDGNMGAYFATLDRLAALKPRSIAPAHGCIIEDPAEHITEVAAHRREREAQVMKTLSTMDLRSPEDIAERLYPELDDRLKAMAAQQVLAHLLHLQDRELVTREQDGWRVLSG